METDFGGSMTKLDELRRELDVIDDKIAALFARRMDIGRAVGLYKKHSEYHWFFRWFR